MILEAGEIDSSTVEVGVFGAVAHSQGDRHPHSGDYRGRLVTARGLIQALDWEGGWLILSRERDGLPERIALDRIQRLILIDSPSLELTEGGGGLTTVQADLGDNNGDGHNA